MEYRDLTNPGQDDFPIPDIHAVRIVLPKAYFNFAANEIFRKYPAPERLLGILPTYRDYSDPRIVPYAFSSPDYQATHLNIVVPFGARIAEVQLFTEQDEIIEKETRDAFEKDRQEQISIIKASASSSK